MLCSVYYDGNIIVKSERFEKNSKFCTERLRKELQGKEIMCTVVEAGGIGDSKVSKVQLLHRSGFRVG